MAVCGNIDINLAGLALNKRDKKTDKNRKNRKKYQPLVEKGLENYKKYAGTCGNIK